VDLLGLLRPDLVRSAWRTWGAAGIARRADYEVQKRSGLLRVREARWPAVPPPGSRVARIGIGDAVRAAPPGTWPVPGPPRPGIVLYGGLALEVDVPPDWHRHPLTGHELDGGVHWSELSDHDPANGDIKDVWELSRFGWLHVGLRRWAATGDDALAEAMWGVVEDWHARNPRYLGPHWMCGQESSLRTIGVLVLADALDPSPATTDARRELVARLLHDAVGRVAPTLGYAQSQRNNHATSEAGFLWGAAVLAPWLPGADALRDRAARALTEVVDDQFGPDGAYAQHSPTYQRVALHVLLWCAAVARARQVPLPAGIEDALARSVVHLETLLVPGSEGRVPNLGGNDGALVFDLADGGVGDLRPVIAHAAAATGVASPLGSGRWDEEAAWFGAGPGTAPRPVVAPARATNALTRGSAHAVLRAGALGHRPAHADQLHVDVWLGGHPVAVDPGSFRYTAPAPWGNALAGEQVHNLPRRPGAPQAVQAGRFFWRSWQEAQLLERVERPEVVAHAAVLTLPDATIVHRTVLVADGLIVVADRASAPVEVRWNLLAGSEVAIVGGGARLRGDRWSGAVVTGPGGGVRVLTPVEDDPVSGWQAVSYGVRTPLQPVVVEAGDPDAGGRSEVISVFTVAGSVAEDALDAARGLLADRLDAAAVDAVLLAHQ
jgi:hypothetical protein